MNVVPSALDSMCTLIICGSCDSHGLLNVLAFSCKGGGGSVEFRE